MLIHRFFEICFLSLIYALPSQAQLSYDVTPIYYKDGQSLGYTRDVIQDSTGLLWISSTVQGVHTWDGAKVTTLHKESLQNYFPIKEGVQFGLRADGNILMSDWGYTHGRIYEYNPYSRALVDSIEQNQKVKKRLYDFALDDNNRLWAASDPFDEGDFVYLFRELKEGELTIVDTVPVNTFLTLLPVQEGVLITADQSIRKYDHEGRLIKIYELKDEEGEVSPFHVVRNTNGEIYTKSDHGLRETSRSKAFFRLNIEEDEFEKVELVEDSILELTQYFKFIDDELWVGGWTGTLWCKNLVTGSVENYTGAIKKETLNNTFYINGVYKDSSEVRWVTTSKGLLRLTPVNEKKPGVVLDSSEGFCKASCRVHAIAEASYKVYFSYKDKLVEMDKADGSFRELEVDVDVQRKGTVQVDIWDLGSDRLSIVGDKVLWNDLLINPKTEAYEDLLDEHPDYRVANKLVNDSTIWFAPFYRSDVSELLYSYDLNTGTLKNISPEVELNAEDVFTSIHVDTFRGSVWIGSRGMGILEFDMNGGFRRQIQKVDPLNGREIGFYSFISNEDVVWVGTDSGLGKLDPESGRIEFIPNYLASDQGFRKTTNSLSLFSLNDSTIWVASKIGLHRFNTNIEKFDTPELPLALKTLEASVTSPYQDSLGNIYFGTVNGVTVASIDNPEVAWRTHYKVSVTKYSRYDQSEDREIFVQSGLGQLKEIVLDHRDLWFTLSYMFPDYSRSVMYTHKLEGFDQEWSLPTTSGYMRYTRPPPGKYTLKLMAGVDGLNFSDAGIEISIVVKRAWYYTWWFYSICALLIGILAFLIAQNAYRIRLDQARKIQALRTKISSDLHDDVGTALTGISMQSEVWSKFADGKTKDTFLKLSKESRKAMDNMRDIVWALDSRKDKVENLVDRMKNFAYENLGRVGIQCHFNTDEVDGKAFINPEKRQQIYYIFKEAITNIVKHSSASTVTVEFVPDGKLLNLEIRDNGKEAHKVSTPSDGLGVSNMKMRAEKIGAECRIKKEDGFSVAIMGI